MASNEVSLATSERFKCYQLKIGDRLIPTLSTWMRDAEKRLRRELLKGPRGTTGYVMQHGQVCITMHYRQSDGSIVGAWGIPKLESPPSAKPLTVSSTPRKKTAKSPERRKRSKQSDLNGGQLWLGQSSGRKPRKPKP